MPRRINPASVRFLKSPDEITGEEEILLEVDEQREEEKLAPRIKEKIKELSKDYDLSDMKPHDWTMFREMAALMVRLEQEQETVAKMIREGELDETNALRAEQRLAVMREGILKIQESLGLTRAKRIDQVENDPRILFEDIKSRAKKFLEARLCKIVCPKCNVQLCSVHFTFPDVDNRLTLVCKHCGHVLNLSSEDALKLEAKNVFV